MTDSTRTPTSEHHGKAVALAVAAAVGGFLFGFDSSVINGAVDAIEGHFDLAAYDAYLNGRMSDTETPDERFAPALAALPAI